MKEKLQELAKRMERIRETLETEEATKTALVMPFFNTLDYDVFNPAEFIPEFTCDVGIKKGEKIDYAIKKNDTLIMVIECKKTGYDLSKVDSQLIRYFHATDARIAIMTDGLKYKFYSDLDKDNVMDKEPFFEFDLENLSEQQINDIDKFKKENFDIDNILSLASDMRTVEELKSVILNELTKPSNEFIKLLITEIHDGAKTKQVTDFYAPFVKKAFTQVINDKVANKLNNALSGIEDNEEEMESKIITTENELLIFQMVKSILAEKIDIDNISYKDTESYFGILLDNNIRKWICRVNFLKDGINIYLNDGSRPEGTKIKLNKINEIFNLRDSLIDCLERVK